MRLSCPSCDQSFSVPDNAIGAKGRKLRCSKCGHEWHQTLIRPAAEEKTKPKSKKAAKAEAKRNAKPKTKAKPAPPPEPEEEEEEGGAPFLTFGTGEAPPEESAGEESDLGADRLDAPPLPRSRLAGLRPEPKRRTGRVVAGGLIGLAVVALIVLVTARASLVAAWPPAARLFDSVGLGVPVVGEDLVIQNVGAWRRVDGNIELLLVRGEIRNPSDLMQTVPALKGTLKGQRGDIMQEWLFRSDSQILLPGEKAAFQYELPQPGADAAEVTVTFSAEGPAAGIGY